MIDFALGAVSAFLAGFVPGQLLFGKAYVLGEWTGREENPKQYWVSVAVQMATGISTVLVAFARGAFS